MTNRVTSLKDLMCGDNPRITRLASNVATAKERLNKATSRLDQELWAIQLACPHRRCIMRDGYASEFSGYVKDLAYCLDCFAYEWNNGGFYALSHILESFPKDEFKRFETELTLPRHYLKYCYGCRRVLPEPKVYGRYSRCETCVASESR